MSKWFAANRLVPSLDKTSIIKCIANNSPRHALHIDYNGNCIEESENTKFLGFQIHNHLNLTNHIDEVIPKLSAACHAVRCMCHINTDTLKSVYFASGIVFGGNLSNSKGIFTLRKKK
jgi:hypothetical protein